VERINQLNILRESNAILRADCKNQAKRSRELETKLQSLSAELEPSEEEVQRYVLSSTIQFDEYHH
jgi:nucleoprotein TPR